MGAVTSCVRLPQRAFFDDERAYRRVVYLRFRGHGERYVPMNVLNQPYDAHDVARLVLEAWTRAWPALAGGAAPVVEQLVLASSYTLIRNALPLTAMGRLLTDIAYRHRLLAHVDDAEVIACFERFEAAGRRGGLLSESTLRRSFLMQFSLALRYSLGCMENVLQFSEHMAHNVTVLCDLSSLDDDTKRFIGCLLMGQLEAATLARADLPPTQRHPYQVIIDEAPVFMSQSAVAFDHLLTQARKFGVSLTLAAQVWGQTKQLHAVVPNSTLIAFRLSHEDATTLAPWLFTPDPYRIKHQVADPYRAAMSHPMYMSLAEQRAEFEQQLQHLAPQEAIIRVGNQTTRIRTVTVPDMPCSEEQFAAIADHYAHLLLAPRADIEAQWTQWSSAGVRLPTQPTRAHPPAPAPPPSGASARPPRHQRIVPLDEDT